MLISHSKQCIVNLDNVCSIGYNIKKIVFNTERQSIEWHFESSKKASVIFNKLRKYYSTMIDLQKEVETT